MNRARKGYRKEYLAKKEIEKEGYTLLFKSQRIRFGRIDFGPFDLVAIRGDHWRFISVKHRTSGDIAENRKAILSFMETHALHNMSFELWIWHAPRYAGRGKNKEWVHAHWAKEVL
jgi:Holliday junction resolvase-like predicted endonuclease